MSARNGRAAERRLRRRRRKLAAATSTVLLVAAAVAGEPISLAASGTQVAGGIGGGLKGMTDPSEVGASGRLHEDDQIGAYLPDSDVDDLLDGADVPTDGELGIPGTMLDAYMTAAERLAVDQPNCKLDWPLLASIGRIESNHARGGRLDDEGNTTPNILGPVLNGGGFAAIRDTDGGRLDGDNRWDRAVGAMQFIPSTWAGYAADGNDDGVKSPHNVYDATLAAGKYLCSGNMDLSNPSDRAAAVFRYNHSNSYVQTVLMWADAYATGVSPMPDYDAPYDDDYGYGDSYGDSYGDGGGGGGHAAGPPSNGSTPPVVGPSTNPAPHSPPPGGPPTGSSSPPSATTKVPPPTPCLPASTTTPPATEETTPTTTEETAPTTTEETSPTTSESSATTSPSSATPPPNCGS